nr:sugar transferase [Ruegeria marisrubri]
MRVPFSRVKEIRFSSENDVSAPRSRSVSQPQPTPDETHAREGEVSRISSASEQDSESAENTPIGRSASAKRRRAATGFVPRSEVLHRIYNASLASVLLFMVLPLVGIISLGLYITQSRPIFYRGKRVGRGGTLFDIYKFRTLDTEKAAALTKDQVLPDGSGLETPLGSFLRETRLDEIPQLWNVIKGDMNICGPRPVRPEIAAKMSSGVRSFQVRFDVKPGLLGPSQALMSHGTPKAVRARLNAAMCTKPVSYLREAQMIVLVASCVLARSFTSLTSKVVSKVRKPGGRQDAGDRASRSGVEVAYRCAGGKVHPVLRIDADRFVLREPVSGNGGELIITLPDGSRRTAGITTEPTSETPAEGTVLKYAPRSEFSHYILERYLLQRVVVPHPSHFLFNGAARAVRRSFASLEDTPAPQASTTIASGEKTVPQ